jgi:hypothetical protein
MEKEDTAADVLDRRRIEMQLTIGEYHGLMKKRDPRVRSRKKKNAVVDG